MTLENHCKEDIFLVNKFSFIKKGTSVARFSDPNRLITRTVQEHCLGLRLNLTLVINRQTGFTPNSGLVVTPDK